MVVEGPGPPNGAVFIDPHVQGDVNKKLQIQKLIFEGAKGSPLSHSGAKLHNTRYMQPAKQKAVEMRVHPQSKFSKEASGRKY
jgi:hypothetical protein